ncbi:hypothetical protein HQ865_11470 [Mucilaginibacter mali]|uniref:Lipoprotein n=1 Tax=Mucilaginibacter mali TaxID=2740462 RepID=A0A7D4UD93_9SPHI|nr:hypothetical protein [Mucilaginibacter mali]QKJ28396.1 hypothetical protein HQ865_01010 [Mucilaginibacter mali]QKJ30319.1 hypothetical protein HQ865_11290 [Mucilaginibacter mali]QKJ30351.1 hypothetical protein HQ865_11470 [Mucilaginibacter mali]
MNKRLLILLLIATATWTSCNSSSTKSSSDSLNNTGDTSKAVADAKQKAIDAQMAKGNRSDSEEETPSQSDEKNRILKSYDDVKTIDTMLVNGNDSLNFHLKYYCLKNTNLLVPKSYDIDKSAPKDFLTHEFASDVLLVNKRDTVLKKQFRASDFAPYFKDEFGGNLKKYGTILMPNLSRRNKDKSQIVLVYSLAIPTTDIGKGVFLIISKNGDYKVVENYNGQ